MRSSEEASGFVRAGLAAGEAPEALEAALVAAGWSGREAAAALARWQARPGLPPVPRPEARLPAREALVQGLGFVALAVIAWHAVGIGFLLAERLVPLPGEAPAWPGAARWPVAMLVAFLPIMVAVRLRRAEGATAPRRWAAAASGLVAALVLVGSLASAVHAGLSGDLTARFGLKLAAVVGMAALVFAAYRAELAGPAAGRRAMLGIAAVALAAIGAGLWLSGGPARGQAERRDAVRDADLAALAAQAQCLAAEGRDVPPLVPSEACPGQPRLADPATGAPYLLETVAGGRLRLCAPRETEAPWAGDPGRPGCILIELRPPQDRLPQDRPAPSGPSLVPPSGGILAE